MNAETVGKLYQLYATLKGLEYQYNHFTTAPVTMKVHDPMWLDPYRQWQKYPVPDGVLEDMVRRYVIEDLRLKIQSTKSKITSLGGDIPS